MTVSLFGKESPLLFGKDPHLGSVQGFRSVFSKLSAFETNVHTKWTILETTNIPPKHLSSGQHVFFAFVKKRTSENHSVKPPKSPPKEGSLQDVFPEGIVHTTNASSQAPFMAVISRSSKAIGSDILYVPVAACRIRSISMCEQKIQDYSVALKIQSSQKHSEEWFGND